MTNRSDRGLVIPRGSQRFERDDMIRELIRASSHAVLRKQAEHMDAPDRNHQCRKPLRSRGRPHMKPHISEVTDYLTTLRLKPISD